ncbi:hypothetical protein ACIPEN_03055 [Herbaspirillum chlorophenolicum]|uniref:Uncharacterized protein n=1 Tax=Herbaspirillum chlorophenolicum TaxID=211589 RepID=A0ABW8ETJ3_9BURK|nr:hypothetical protein [Herbaspirillum chlorophenolicum]
MKKSKFFHLAATAQPATQPSNWKFGWSASSVNAQIEGRRSLSQHPGTGNTGVYGVLVVKPSSGW